MDTCVHRIAEKYKYGFNSEATNLNLMTLCISYCICMCFILKPVSIGSAYVTYTYWWKSTNWKLVSSDFEGGRYL